MYGVGIAVSIFAVLFSLFLHCLTIMPHTSTMVMQSVPMILEALHVVRLTCLLIICFHLSVLLIGQILLFCRIETLTLICLQLGRFSVAMKKTFMVECHPVCQRDVLQTEVGRLLVCENVAYWNGQQSFEVF